MGELLVLPERGLRSLVISPGSATPLGLCPGTTENNGWEREGARDQAAASGGPARRPECPAAPWPWRALGLPGTFPPIWNPGLVLPRGLESARYAPGIGRGSKNGPSHR